MFGQLTGLHNTLLQPSLWAQQMAMQGSAQEQQLAMAQYNRQQLANQLGAQFDLRTLQYVWPDGRRIDEERVYTPTPAAPMMTPEEKAAQVERMREYDRRWRWDRRRKTSNRWEDRMFRLVEKEREKHLRALRRAGVVLAWVWGSILVVVITTLLLRLSTLLILG